MKGCATLTLEESINPVRVTNYGGRITNYAFSVILAGKARSVLPYEVQNNIVENCIFQGLGDFAGASVLGEKMKTSLTLEHRDPARGRRTRLVSKTLLLPLIAVLLGGRTLSMAAEILAQPQPAEGEIVVPNEKATSPGSAATDVPFSPGTSIIFRQQMYDASQFGPLRDGGYITGVSFRMQEGEAFGFDATYSHFEVQLATFHRPINTLPIFYSPQDYPDATTVFSRDNAHFSGNSSTSPDIPAPFDFHITFDKPFPFNPGSGNLLIYLEAGKLTGGRGFQVDLEGQMQSPVGYTSYGVVGGPFFETGALSLVAQFNYVAVPESGTGGLFLFGIVLLFLGSKYVNSRRINS